MFFQKQYCNDKCYKIHVTMNSVKVQFHHANKIKSIIGFKLLLELRLMYRFNCNIKIRILVQPCQWPI